jgi:pilus assembly protein CpaC
VKIILGQTLANLLLITLVLTLGADHSGWAKDSVKGKKDDLVPERNIEVVLGIDKVEKLDFPPSTKVQVGNRSILNYQLIPQKREITLKGLKPGNTSVIIRNPTGDIKARYLVTVTANEQSKVVRELKDFLGDIEGLEIGIKGDMVYIGGEIVVPADIGRVVMIGEKYPAVLRLVELSPHTKRRIAKRMQDEIQKSGARDVTVRIVNKAFWLEGVVSSVGQKKNALKIAMAYLPEDIESLAQRLNSVRQVQGQKPIHNFVVVNQKKKKDPLPKLIKITAQFVELSKDYNRIFGVKWTPMMTDAGATISFGKTADGSVVTRSANTIAGTISNLFPKLASAKAAGHARILQSGMVMVEEGKEGTIEKSSEKDIILGVSGTASGGDAATETTKAKAGLTLNIVPTVLKEQKEKVRLEVKNLSVNATSGDPPTNFTNKIVTTLVVDSKKTAVVGGAAFSETVTDFDRNPPFGVDSADPESGNTNPLFSFLKSKSYINKKSQFAVFITAEIVASASDDTAKVKRKFRRRMR